MSKKSDNRDRIQGMTNARGTGGAYRPRHSKKPGLSRKKVVLVSIMSVSIAGLAFAGITLGYQSNQSAGEKKVYEELRSQVIAQTATVSTAPTADIAPEPTPVGSWYASYASPADREVDFDALKEINEDVYAWITVEGTEIDYPILHVPADDPTYLDHDFYKQKSDAGAIYTDGWNSGDLSDPNTLIYGHNMKNKTMFAQLRNFQQKDFFAEHDRVTIYLPDGTMLGYKIFASYMVPATHILAINDFHDETFYASYLKSIFETTDKDAHIKEVDLTVEDRLITLVTCVGDTSRRLFIQAVLEPAEPEKQT